MTTSAKRRGSRRAAQQLRAVALEANHATGAVRASGGGATAPAPASPMWTNMQRAWWMVGVLGGLVVTLGFQLLSPSRRLSDVERENARQDSVIAAGALAQREALDTIRRQVGQLLAGQCVKERDRMARVVFGCGG